MLYPDYINFKSTVHDPGDVDLSQFWNGFVFYIQSACTKPKFKQMPSWVTPVSVYPSFYSYFMLMIILCVCVFAHNKHSVYKNNFDRSMGRQTMTRQTCMFLRSWKISMVLMTMSWTVSWPMRHSEAVFTSRAWVCCGCCCCCCCCGGGGGCPPKGDTRGGVVMETAG